MSRGPCTFRQRDLTAAVKAVEAAGIGVARVEVDKDGKIIIIPGKPPVVPFDLPTHGLPEPDLGM
ncbi:hypothetical protein G3545_04400 [Starkeya sp. ORNL1]|uniref:hypothetical protein n=1 Tax=Starkeya sp. ORNL1 TaxID=2709380 RepID=UPI001462DC8F|nr:hypothetical protein [Starkeya sp. ORNL1]QJP12964.1 hypothetical protein G3545_04400 [Starkeya sp. ORNL1]